MALSSAAANCSFRYSPASPSRARNLAQKIFNKKKLRLEVENEAPERAENLLFKSDTYMNMEKMIENINKYRQEFSGNREPAFMHHGAERRNVANYTICPP